MKRLVLVLIVAMVFIASSCSKKQSEAPTPPVEKDITQHLFDISSPYLEKADKEIQPIYAKGQEAYIPSIMARIFSDFSQIPQVEMQRELFQGNYMIVVAKELTGTEIKVIGQYMESPRIKLYIVPADSLEEIAKYEKPYQTVMIRNIKFSDIWFIALLSHEMEHARRGDYFPEITEELAESEIHCHDLTRRILDQGTGGKYSSYLQRIVDNKKNASSIKDFYLSVSSDDVFLLDSLSPRPNTIEAQARVTQYLIDLGSVWANENFERDKKEEIKKAVYLFIRFGPQ